MKKTIFYIFLFAFNYLAVETVSYMVYRIKYGDYDLTAINQSKLVASKTLVQGNVFTAEKDQGKVIKRNHIIHPYMGYTVDGKEKKENCEGTVKQCYRRIKVFMDKPFPKRSKESLIVAIVGGSFAAGTVQTSKQQYIDGLHRIDQYKDKEITVVNLAHGGYKQPQQLIHLNYLYSLGAEFDLIINLDGFNEIAIPNTAYRHQGIHPSFPQSWQGYMQTTFSPDLLNAYAMKQTLLKKQVSLASLTLPRGINRSPLLNLVWKMRSDSYLSKISHIDHSIQESSNIKNRDFNYQTLGPDFEFIDWPQFYRYTSNIWAESSKLTKAIADTKGTQYFHFLQPNQHINGNKVLSKQELKSSYSPNGGYGGVYRLGHQYLVERFGDLTNNGVNFYDLTYYFKGTTDTLYIDDCCHMGAKGYGLTVAAITQLIAKKLELNSKN